MNKNRIPVDIPGFNGYIGTTNTRLQAISSGTTKHWERLGLTSQNATDWDDKNTHWRDTLYPKYQNPMQSTSLVKTDVRNFMEAFGTFARPLLNIMAASPNANSDDEGVFRFKIGRAEPVHPSTVITDVVVYEVKRLGGGDLKFICRTSHDNHRASKHPLSDSIQLAHGFNLNNSEDNTGPSVPGSPVPASALPSPDSMAKEIFTKAIFILHLGSEAVGKPAAIFLRWYNTKHPELSGPWSPVTAIVVA